MWVRAKLEHGRQNFWLGYCGKTRHVCKVAADALTPMVVRDFYVDQGVCEEGKRCFHFECPLNKTTEFTLRREYNFKGKKQFTNTKIGQIMLPADMELRSGVMMSKKGGAVLEVYETDT
jgi:hypothetical protein